MKLTFSILTCIVLLFTSCKPYGAEFEHPYAQVFYDSELVQKETVEVIVDQLELYGWIDTIPKSILIGRMNDTLFVNLVTLDRLKNDIPTEKQIAAIGINLSRTLGEVVTTNMADNYLKPIRSYPAIKQFQIPETYADSSIRTAVLEEIVRAKQADTLLPNPEFIYIRKAGPAYHVHMVYPTTDTLDLYAFQDWANETRKLLSDNRQFDVYLSNNTLTKSEVLYGRR